MIEPQTVSGAEILLKRPWHVLTLSAQSKSELETKTEELVEYLKSHPTLDIVDVAYVPRVGQKTFVHRRAVVCKSLGDAISVLESLDPLRVLTTLQEQRDRQVAFMFPGSGSQHVYMGFGLYRTEELFREQIDICSDLLKVRFGFDLRDILYPSRERMRRAVKQLSQTSFGSLALFVTEYALAKLWMGLGVVPAAMIGHSLGEYVAACLAGVFSLEDALVLVFTRGQLLQRLTEGSMLTVSLPEQQARAILGQHLSLAAVNTPSSCVISGPTDAVEALQAELTMQNIECLKLGIGVAGHSQQIEPVLHEFADVIERMDLKPAQMPYVSNVTGGWIEASEATDTAFWLRHLSHTVRFADGLDTLCADPQLALLEVGPGLTLTSFARMHPGRADGQLLLSSLRHLYERTSDSEFLMKTLSRLWLGGVALKASGADEKMEAKDE